MNDKEEDTTYRRVMTTYCKRTGKWQTADEHFEEGFCGGIFYTIVSTIFLYTLYTITTCFYK